MSRLSLMTFQDSSWLLPGDDVGRTMLTAGCQIFIRKYQARMQRDGRSNTAQGEEGGRTQERQGLMIVTSCTSLTTT